MPPSGHSISPQPGAGDKALRAEVEELLSYDAQHGHLLDQHALGMATRILDQQAPRSLAGQRVGHCRLVSLLGRGGMGEVWLAEDTQLARKVAVKLLPAAFTHDAERVRRFVQEARAASALNHPNIITIHEIGVAAQESESTHYLVTEYVAGETLRERMSDAPGRGMRLAEALEVAAQIAAALTAAHTAGIVHRDIKPENVMLRGDGLVKVLDFGLAKLTERNAAAVDSHAPTQVWPTTEPGMVMGTPRYMSPEQARGERVDARSDIFSFGVMLYEMVVGRAPFIGATTSEVIAAILRDAPPPLTDSDAPPELQQIINRALEKDRQARYPQISELLGELNQFKRRVERRDEGLDDEARASQQPQTGEPLARASGTTVLPTNALPPAVTTAEQDGAQTRTQSFVGRFNRQRLGVALVLLLAAVVAAAVYFNLFGAAGAGAYSNRFLGGAALHQCRRECGHGIPLRRHHRQPD